MIKNATARPRRTKTAETTPVRPTDLEIAERAYYRYLERTGENEVSDWLQAEREVRAARGIK